MDIETVLKTTDTRLTWGNDRWLVWEDLMGWSVFERKRYARETTYLYSGISLEIALDILTREEV